MLFERILTRLYRSFRLSFRSICGQATDLCSIDDPLTGVLPVQSMHLALRLSIFLPHSGHRFALFGGLTSGGKDGAPLTSRFVRCVSRVGGADSRMSFAELDQSARVTHSANGATARPHMGAVSDN